MNELKRLIETCRKYKEGELSLIDFQHILENIYLPSDYKYTLEKQQHNAVNQLEKIYYFYPASEYKQHADRVADMLIAAALGGIKQMKNK